MAVGPCTGCLASLGLHLLSHKMQELWSDKLASGWHMVGAHEILASQLLYVSPFTWQMKKLKFQVGPVRARAEPRPLIVAPASSPCAQAWGESAQGRGAPKGLRKGGSREEGPGKGCCLLQRRPQPLERVPRALLGFPGRVSKTAPRVLGPSTSVSSSTERASQTQGSFPLDSRPAPPQLPGHREHADGTGSQQGASKEPI